MDNNDLQEFSALMDMVRENYDKPPLGIQIKAMWIQQLGEYSIAQVRDSAMKHLRTSQFSPKLSDLIAGLQGTKPKAREILAAARLKKTPFGVMAAGHIGSWDLNSLDDYALETRAQEIVELYQTWSDAYAVGDIKPRMAALIAKSGVLMGAPFVDGAVSPPHEVGAYLMKMANGVLEQEQAAADALQIEQQRVDAITPEERLSNHAKLMKIIGSLGQVEAPKLKDVQCPVCGYEQLEILKTCENCRAKRNED